MRSSRGKQPSREASDQAVKRLATSEKNLRAQTPLFFVRFHKQRFCLWPRDFASRLLKLRVMAHHPDSCEICARIENIKAAAHPGFIAELPTGYAVLGDSQFFRGYSLFLCKVAAPDLEDLPRDFRFQFLREMAFVSEAVSTVLKPQKMNVESLGNVVPHLHFHLFPRFATEAEPLKPVWLCAPQGEEAAKFAFDAARDGELITEIRTEITRVMR